MALSRTDRKTYPTAPETVFGNATAAMNSTFGNVTQTGPTTLLSDAKLGWLSWGEKVTCEVQPDPAGAAVTITSRSAFPAQFIDWGVHRKNLNKVFTALG